MLRKHSTTTTTTAESLRASMRGILSQIGQAEQDGAIETLLRDFAAATSTGSLFIGGADGIGEQALCRAIYGQEHPALIENTGTAETIFAFGDAYLSSSRLHNAQAIEALFALCALVALESQETEQ
jgi:hypothetical protein